MKKLMIAAAITMMAVASQAASFVWSADGAKGEDWMGEFIGDTANVNAFLYLGEIAFDTTTKCTLVLNPDLMLTSSEQNIETYMYGDSLNPKPSDKLASDAAGQKYTIILAETTSLDAPGLTDGKHFALLTGSTTQDKDPMADPPVTWANMVNKTILEHGNWQTWDSSPTPPPVPEPTSAMLLLLGVAGLALRRKTK